MIRASISALGNGTGRRCGGGQPLARISRQTLSTIAEPAPKNNARWLMGSAAVTLAVACTYTILRPVHLKDETSHLPDPSAPTDQASGRGLIPYIEVNKHNQPDDCWVVIAGKVYDLTEFAENHPGGIAPIHRVAGRDATAIFAPIHPPGTIENGLPPENLVGTVDPATLPKVVDKKKEDGKERRVDLAEIIGLPDFDAAAKANLTSKAWAYMSSGATDQYTLDLNRKAFNSILFRPRIMIDVEYADTRTEMLGQETSLPIFISPAGMAKLAHPSGECLLASAAGKSNIIQMISTNASAPLSDIISSATSPDQPFFMQLYVDRNRAKAEALLEKIDGLGLKAIFVTVDAAAPGKREADDRSRAEVEVASGISGGKIGQDTKGGGIGRSVGGFIDPKLSWKDLEWLRSHTKVPIGLKGVQTVEDAIKAAEMGVNAIYLSNHGGRALDGSPPAMYTLLEINKYCPDLLEKCEIYVDGGCRRGTDVVKALCLGAKGVGMGRPFLYSLTYGEEGVIHAIEIMRDEIETTMRLLGVTRLDQLGPHLLNTRALDPLVFEQPVWGPKEKPPA
ncbi:L-lactate dehydrogenase (cytochrome) [Cryptococcus wingfieldii CBS 7118]|uniref:L-lactate dehydrogenase (cytochrome) n=1 Tax=Cryptococcus wingfieldii CBS 7118 TaxID=1295528 RepID=A0A1E3IEQ5_9TREE|nr:L-lactate dehydrogenase (cytochrome) [Cryptococcus wingfieldii CBS 7118]ODN87112.1 L-lactate dehydrogenase (cytochrome) [Cryptococcus wingfieldii CBS 7118]